MAAYELFGPDISIRVRRESASALVYWRLCAPMGNHRYVCRLMTQKLSSDSNSSALEHESRKSPRDFPREEAYETAPTSTQHSS